MLRTEFAMQMSSKWFIHDAYWVIIMAVFYDECVSWFQINAVFHLPRTSLFYFLSWRYSELDWVDFVHFGGYQSLISNNKFVPRE